MPRDLLRPYIYTYIAKLAARKPYHDMHIQIHCVSIYFLSPSVSKLGRVSHTSRQHVPQCADCRPGTLSAPLSLLTCVCVCERPLCIRGASPHHAASHWELYVSLSRSRCVCVCVSLSRQNHQRKLHCNPSPLFGTTLCYPSATHCPWCVRRIRGLKRLPSTHTHTMQIPGLWWAPCCDSALRSP